jgi:ubiquinone/menaquinone biosynthesis C-methylase UbiE
MPYRTAPQRSRLAFAFLLAVLFAAAAPARAGEAEAPPPPDYETLQKQFQKEYEGGDHTAALATAETMLELTFEKHIATLYNIAAMHSLLGHKKQAYQWLQYTLDAGWYDYRKLREDEDFALIREEEKFKSMIRGAWAKQYLAMLEREERDEFQQPDRVMQTLAFKPGERVADVGAGSGYFTVRVARAVGPEGKVLATDIRQEMLDFLENRLEEEQIGNVELKLTEKDDPMLPAGSLDTILLVDVWHYIRDPEFAKKLAAGLAPGGRLVVIDYRPKPFEERPWGPPEVQQTPREEVDEQMALAGLKPVRSHDYLSEQYFVEYQAE